MPSRALLIYATLPLIIANLLDFVLVFCDLVLLRLLIQTFGRTVLRCIVYFLAAEDVFQLLFWLYTYLI